MLWMCWTCLNDRNAWNCRDGDIDKLWPDAILVLWNYENVELRQRSDGIYDIMKSWMHDSQGAYYYEVMKMSATQIHKYY